MPLRHGLEDVERDGHEVIALAQEVYRFRSVRTKKAGDITVDGPRDDVTTLVVGVVSGYLRASRAADEQHALIRGAELAREPFTQPGHRP